MKSRLKTIAGITVGVLFVYWFAHKLDWAEVWTEARRANLGYMSLAIALLVGTYFVRVLRWRALLEPLAHPPLKALFRATVVGFSALFLMGRAGEIIVRPAVLSVKDRVHPSASYATVMIERVFDMVMVVFFFAINLIFFEYVGRNAEATQMFVWIKITGALLLCLSIAGIYGLSLFRSRRAGVLSFLDRKLNWLPSQIKRGLLSLLSHISEGLAVLHDARGLTITVSYTVLLWLMVSVAHMLVVRAFGIPYADIPFTGAVFLMGVSMLGSVVPTPGGATGPFHTAAAGSLIFLGVEQNKAASIAIVLHLAIFAPVTLFGMFYIIKDGLSLGRLRRLGQKQVEDVDSIDGLPRQQEEDETVIAAQPAMRDA